MDHFALPYEEITVKIVLYLLTLFHTTRMLYYSYPPTDAHCRQRYSLPHR